MCAVWIILALFSWTACGLIAVWVGRSGGYFKDAPLIAQWVTFLLAPFIVFWSALRTLREARRG